MGIELKMPALSPTMEEGTLAKWLVKEGDEVAAGDILAEIETDKATMEFEAVDEGTIGKIVVAEGTENVKVGEVIAVMAGEGGETAEQANSTGEVAAPADDPKAAESETPKAAKDEGGSAQLASDAKPARDPEVPAGTPMKTVTVREALRDAMAEEMR